MDSSCKHSKNRPCCEVPSASEVTTGQIVSGVSCSDLPSCETLGGGQQTPLELFEPKTETRCNKSTQGGVMVSKLRIFIIIIASIIANPPSSYSSGTEKTMKCPIREGRSFLNHRSLFKTIKAPELSFTQLDKNMAATGGAPSDHRNFITWNVTELKPQINNNKNNRSHITALKSLSYFHIYRVSDVINNSL